MTIWITFVTLLQLVTSTCRCDDWPNWRGPNRNGISHETNWSDQWPVSGPRIVWKSSVGTGFSSMVVSEGRLFTMGNEDETDSVFCLDAETGDEVWSHSYACPLDDRFFAGGPTATPTVDGSHVYALSRQGHLFCFEAATGAIHWSINVVEKTEVRVPGWGFSGSPFVHGDTLILNVGEAGLAVDKLTGETVWASANKEAGYATPVLVEQADQLLAIIPSAKFIIAVDVQSGKERWRHRWLTRFGCNAADAIQAGEYLFISSGYNRGCALLKLTGDQPQVVWDSKEMQNQFNSSVLIDGFLYGIDGDTTSDRNLKCIELMTGQLQWTQSGVGSGSLMAADGKLVLLSESGELMIAPASPESFQPSARAQIMHDKCWTVPVLANGRIYCRDAQGEVVCVNVRH